MNNNQQLTEDRRAFDAAEEIGRVVSLGLPIIPLLVKFLAVIKMPAIARLS
jgi:hypothetical protein